jgi:hypothetical protein
LPIYRRKHHKFCSHIKVQVPYTEKINPNYFLILYLMLINQLFTQRVTTWCVYIRFGEPKKRANPKSASLILPERFINKLLGFKSYIFMIYNAIIYNLLMLTLCKIKFRCKCSSPRKTCISIFFIWECCNIALLSLIKF